MCDLIFYAGMSILFGPSKSQQPGLASSCEAALRTRRMAVFVAKKVPFFLWSDGPTWSIGDLWAIYPLVI